MQWRTAEHALSPQITPGDVNYGIARHRMYFPDPQSPIPNTRPLIPPGSRLIQRLYHHWRQNPLNHSTQKGQWQQHQQPNLGKVGERP